MKKRTQIKKGFLNRHVDGMPKKRCKIKILYEDLDGDMILDCIWDPYKKKSETQKTKTDETYLGIIKSLDFDPWFEVFSTNNDKFVYYKFEN